MRLINARYASKCRICKSPVRVGERVWYTKGIRGVMHENCRNAEKTPVAKPNANAPVPSNNPVIENVASRDFMVDWHELKSLCQSTLNGNLPRMRVSGHAARFSEYLGKSGGDNWTGYAREDVSRWIERGYQLDGLNFENPPIPIREKRRWIHAEDAEELVVDRALSGEDLAFGEFTKREVIPGLAIEAEIRFRSDVSHNVLSAYYQFLCRAIYALEKSGVDLQVTLNVSVTGLYRKSPNVHRTIIRVKRENEATDFHSWSAMLSPASLRAFGFNAMLLHADSENLEAGYGLGGSVPGHDTWRVTWNPTRQMVEIGVDTAASRFPADDMEIQLRNALAAMHNPV